MRRDADRRARCRRRRETIAPMSCWCRWIGRGPNTDELALDKAGLAVRQGSRHRPQLQDASRHLGGSATWFPPDARSQAEDEGIAWPEFAGLTGIVNHDVIPSVVFTPCRILPASSDRRAAKEHGGSGREITRCSQHPRQDNREPTASQGDADAKTAAVLGVDDRLGRRDMIAPCRAGNGVRRD